MMDPGKESSIKLKILSPLVKIFDDEEPIEVPEAPIPSGFKNETLSFQVAFAATPPHSEARDSFAEVEIDSPLKDWIRLRSVSLVPVGLPTFPDADGNYLRKKAGLFPDLLTELKDDTVRVRLDQWRALWIDVEADADTPAGVHPVTITLRSIDKSGRFPEKSGRILAEARTRVEILEALLPEQELIHTKWFHSDCLADYYGVPIFGERHWEIIEKFMVLAVKRGMNMILTPTMTPPLDTAVGEERPTTQLVEVTKTREGYAFGFDKLKRWVELSLRCGFRYFEMTHLFSQWGAERAPKVEALVEGERKRIFGWETDALGEEYKGFLAAYLPALTAKLKEWGIGDRVFFHVSDEPGRDHLESYKAAKSIVAPLLKGFPIIDALSDVEFYKSGVVEKPIPSNDHIHPFIDEKVEGLWTYYCVSQYREVSNVFIAMPSARNRIFGAQLYKYDIEGILHWGYNFYNSQYSIEPINPYLVTDGDGFSPGGDPFQVYPGRDGGPEESIRIMVTAQALYDLRAFKMLEGLTDKSFVLNLIEGELEEPLTFNRYPVSELYLLRLRDRVNREIAKRIGGAS